MIERTESKNFELTAFNLKIIAVATMLIDHTACILPDVFSGCYTEMRLIGRVAFPIFCFLLTEGFYYTSSVIKYLFRIGLFAIISEMPFDLAFTGKIYDADHQNVFITLFLGLVALTASGKGGKVLIKWLCEKLNKDIKAADSPLLQCAAGLPVIILCAVLAEYLSCDYGYCGVLMICAFYMFRERKAMSYIALILINSLLCVKFSFSVSQINGLISTGTVVIYDTVQWVAPLALIPIILYKGNAGRKSLKYAFYAFYPLHIFVLYLFSLI